VVVLNGADNCLQGEPVPGPLPLGVAVIDSSVRLYGLVFPHVAHKHRLQMLEHFGECIKQAKASRQQAIQINIFTAVLYALKVGHAMRLNSRTGIEGPPVSSLKCDRSLHSGLKAPELVMAAGGRDNRWTASLCTSPPGCSPLMLLPSQGVGSA